MARKNILSGLLDENRPRPAETPPVAPEIKSASGMKGIGALGAVTRSIDALAAKAEEARQLQQQLATGAVIVELEPQQIERSFISDRMVEDSEAFRDLVEAIRQRGQDSPILVRPHPGKPGKYQIAFGHRRARAAEALGIPVKAVVKELTDVEHVIAQGQENSARADLSFIERALFAGRLEMAGYSRDVIMSALGADKTTVSKMLSVNQRVPGDILNGILQARGIGRDRWHELATLFNGPGDVERARWAAERKPYVDLSAEDRFQFLVNLLKSPATAPQQKVPLPSPAVRENWQREGGRVKAVLTRGPKKYTIALKAAEAEAFGDFIASQLDSLYEAFEQNRNRTDGD